MTTSTEIPESKTPTSKTPTSNISVADRLAEVVAQRASTLQDEYHADKSAAVRDLAILRRGVSQRPGADARLVGLTMAGIHPDPTGLSDDPTDAERAAYAALTLFALHQQSQRTKSMHRKDYSFGRSARLLGRRSNAQDAVRRRFTAVATATTTDELLHHARGLVQQLRAHEIPLDYGRFARDLYFLQQPSAADRVRLAWGRDFYRVRHAEDDRDSADTADDDATSDALDDTADIHPTA